MGRIIAIDYGLKRTGLAVTDELKLIASALETVPTEGLKSYLQTYFQQEHVERIVVGMPLNLDASDTDVTQNVRVLIENLSKWFPGIPVHTIDERFTSKMAMDAMVRGGVKKKGRRNKANIDKISATIILQSFMMQQ